MLDIIDIESNGELYQVTHDNGIWAANRYYPNEHSNIDNGTLHFLFDTANYELQQRIQLFMVSRTRDTNGDRIGR